MKIAEIHYKEKNEWYESVESYILFDNGEKLSSVHEDDCCEEVFADFKNMQVMGEREKNYVNANDLDFFDNILDSVVPIEGLGFYLVTKQGICILVSCYNVQNGYYSSQLQLEYAGQIMDISPCVPDCKDDWEGARKKNAEKLKELGVKE